MQSFLLHLSNVIWNKMKFYSTDIFFYSSNCYTKKKKSLKYCSTYLNVNMLSNHYEKIRRKRYCASIYNLIWQFQKKTSYSFSVKKSNLIEQECTIYVLLAKQDAGILSGWSGADPACWPAPRCLELERPKLPLFTRLEDKMLRFIAYRLMLASLPSCNSVSSWTMPTKTQTNYFRGQTSKSMIVRKTNQFFIFCPCSKLQYLNGHRNLIHILPFSSVWIERKLKLLVTRISPDIFARMCTLFVQQLTWKVLQKYYVVSSIYFIIVSGKTTPYMQVAPQQISSVQAQYCNCNMLTRTAKSVQRGSIYHLLSYGFYVAVNLNTCSRVFNN